MYINKIPNNEDLENIKQAHNFNYNIKIYYEKLDIIALSLAKDIDAMWERLENIYTNSSGDYEVTIQYTQIKVKYEQAQACHRNYDYTRAIQLYLEIHTSITHLMFQYSIFYNKYSTGKKYEDSDI